MDYRLNHYSPVFANKPWVGENAHYTCYYRDEHQRRVGRRSVGRKQWGRTSRLYRKRVELSLGEEVDSPAARIYADWLRFKPPVGSDRVKWAQFLMSQLVRTPCYMRYEKAAMTAYGVEGTPANDRVGCEDCGDLTYITERDWMLLMSHNDDAFVRTDNPALLSGFLPRPETALFYPLNPRMCFVACSMSEGWAPTIGSHSQDTEVLGFALPKGGAQLLNFWLSKCADHSIVLYPDSDNDTGAEMYRETLGIYPQPPFMIHNPAAAELPEAYQSVRGLMALVDGIDYAPWDASEIEGFDFGRCDRVADSVE